MSDWKQWIEFVAREAGDEYVQKVPSADNIATWNIAISGIGTADMYATSDDIGYSFDDQKPVLKMLSDAAAGEETNIFMQPPAGYTIIGGVDCGDLKVMQGKNKQDGNHVIFATNAAVTCIVALVHINNNNRGVTSYAVDAFAKAVEKAMGYGI